MSSWRRGRSARGGGHSGRGRAPVPTNKAVGQAEAQAALQEALGGTGGGSSSSDAREATREEEAEGSDDEESLESAEQQLDEEEAEGLRAAAAAAAAAERLRLMELAEAQERRADAAWRELHEEQRRRQAEAERVEEELCMLATTCRELRLAALDDALWLPMADALPANFAYSRLDRAGEAPWRYTLRVREGLFGSWHMLTEHRAGSNPYLHELGAFSRGGRFSPSGGTLPYRLKYGVVCELVMHEAEAHGGLSHGVYKVVAEQLIALSANRRSAVPPDMHMTVREIYKTCYPGFGAGLGSGAYASGLQAGGSSTRAATAGPMLGKGVAALTRKANDEEMRRRLDTVHEFLALVP